MSRAVNVIFDVSGSLFIDGKDSVQVNLLMTIISAMQKPMYLNSSIDIYLLEWADEVYEINPDEVYTEYISNCMKFGGKADVEKLIQYIKDVGDNNRFLIISDGLFSNDEMISLRNVANGKKVVVVAIGADANCTILSNIANPNHICYQAEDILSALHDVCFKPDIVRDIEQKNTRRERQRSGLGIDAGRRRARHEV